MRCFPFHDFLSSTLNGSTKQTLTDILNIQKTYSINESIIQTIFPILPNLGNSSTLNYLLMFLLQKIIMLASLSVLARPAFLNFPQRAQCIIHCVPLSAAFCLFHVLKFGNHNTGKWLTNLRMIKYLSSSLLPEQLCRFLVIVSFSHSYSL